MCIDSFLKHLFDNGFSTPEKSIYNQIIVKLPIS